MQNTFEEEAASASKDEIKERVTFLYERLGYIGRDLINSTVNVVKEKTSPNKHLNWLVVDTVQEIGGYRPNFKKVVMIGRVREYNGRAERVFFEIEFKHGKFSISGVIGPRSNGHCIGSCGQINMGLSVKDFTSFNTKEGWTRKKVAWLFEVWDRWHLNDMRAGTPVQQQFIKDNQDLYDICKDLETFKNKSHYKIWCFILGAYNIKYQDYHEYGHAWLKEDLPQDVYERLFNIVPTNEKYPWG